MTSAFEKLCGPGKALKTEPPDAKEFAGLLRSGKARLKDASVKTLELESRFDLAYNAARAALLGGASLARLSLQQSQYRVPVAAEHAGLGAGGMARTVEVPRDPQPRRI